MPAIDLTGFTGRLYEDTALSDELPDQAAVVLLKWGEQQLQRLAEKHTDAAAFEVDFERLRDLLKGINRFFRRRQELEAERLADYLQRRVIEPAQALGWPVNPAAAQACLEKQATLDVEVIVHTLLEVVLAAPGSSDVSPQATSPHDDILRPGLRSGPED